MEIRYINLDERIPLWTRIQIAYPDEPDWNSLEEEVLVHLVEDFENEQSCATSAILYLASKNPERSARVNVVVASVMQPTAVYRWTVGALSRPSRARG